MKTLLLSLAAAGSLTAAALPAASQPYGDGRYAERHGARDRADVLANLIERGIRRGDLDRREAWRLKGSLRETQRVEHNYWRDGRLTGWERADLDRRYDGIRRDIREERRDRDYGYGYGRDLDR